MRTLFGGAASREECRRVMTDVRQKAAFTTPETDLSHGPAARVNVHHILHLTNNAKQCADCDMRVPSLGKRVSIHRASSRAPGFDAQPERCGVAGAWAPRKRFADIEADRIHARG